MAIDVCAEISSPGISPRISFSYDLNKTSDGPPGLRDEDQHRLDSSLLDSDFHFCFNNTNFIQEISPADELFSNGKILPIHKMKPTLPVYYGPTLLKPELVSPRGVCIDQSTSEKKLLKEFLTMSLDQVEEKPSNVSKSFWKFKRSNSLNCDSHTKSNKGLIRSLQFLSRSNSTGSSPNPPKQCNNSGRRRSSMSSVSGSVPFYPYPVLRKCGSYGNGASSVRVSPVLNIPPHCISMGTVSFFGSLFCSGKYKKKKKR